jgi:hypothetical protein
MDSMQTLDPDAGRHPINAPILQIIAAFAACIATGCGSEGLNLAPAAGKVTYNGQSVAGATIVFIGNGPQVKTAIAVSDTDGNFVLQTGKAKGAMPGHYRVTIDKTEVEGDSEERVSMEDVVAGKQQPPPRQLVPPRYADPTQTPLACDVKEGENHFTWDLTD